MTRARLAARLATCLALLAGPAAADAPGSGRCAPPAAAAALTQGLLDTVNARRREAGLEPLRRASGLDGAAAVLACSNARQRALSHQSGRGGTLMARLRDSRVPFSRATEATGGRQTDPQRLEAQWYASAGHRPTLMARGARTTGMAVAQDMGGAYWWVMISVTP